MTIPVTGTNADAARIARAAAAAHERDGLSRVTINAVRFNLTETGYCARFVRLVHEATLELPSWGWQWNAANARQMETRMKANGLAVEDPEPGDVVAINGFPKRPSTTGNRGRADLMRWKVQMQANVHGHIGVRLASGDFAENTSSKVRGSGTVVSRLVQVASRISGYYRPLKSAQKPFRVDYVGTYLQPQDAELRDGQTWVRLGAVLPIEDYLSSLPDPPVGRHMVWRSEDRKTYVKVGHVEEQEEET